MGDLDFGYFLLIVFLALIAWDSKRRAREEDERKGRRYRLAPRER